MRSFQRHLERTLDTHGAAEAHANSATFSQHALNTARNPTSSAAHLGGSQSGREVNSYSSAEGRRGRAPPADAFPARFPSRANKPRAAPHCRIVQLQMRESPRSVAVSVVLLLQEEEEEEEEERPVAAVPLLLLLPLRSASLVRLSCGSATGSRL